MQSELVLKLRNSLAEHGFECTPEEIRNNPNAQKVINRLLDPNNLVIIKKELSKIKERIAGITNMEEIHKIFEEELNEKFTVKQITSYLVLLKLFVKD